MICVKGIYDISTASSLFREGSIEVRRGKEGKQKNFTNCGFGYKPRIFVNLDAGIVLMQSCPALSVNEESFLNVPSIKYIFGGVLLFIVNTS